MIWATTAEVREYLGDELPADYPEDKLTRDIEKAVRSMVPKVLRWPVENEDERAEDEDTRVEVIAAVAELIKYRREQAATAAALPPASAEVLAAGGSITAGKVSVSGGRGAKVGRYAANTLPCETVDALLNAGMIGGSVATW